MASAGHPLDMAPMYSAVILQSVQRLQSCVKDGLDIILGKKSFQSLAKIRIWVAVQRSVGKCRGNFYEISFPSIYARPGRKHCFSDLHVTRTSPFRHGGTVYGP